MLKRYFLKNKVSPCVLRMIRNSCQEAVNPMHDILDERAKAKMLDCLKVTSDIYNINEKFKTYREKCIKPISRQIKAGYLRRKEIRELFLKELTDYKKNLLESGSTKKSKAKKKN